MGLNIKNRLVRSFLALDPPFFRCYRPKAVETATVFLSRHPGIQVLAEEGDDVDIPPPTLNDSRAFDRYKELVQRKGNERFILELRNGRVWGRDCAVISDDGVMLSDVSRQFGASGDHTRHFIFNTPLLRRPVMVEGRTAVISTAGANVYYHWMLDIVPRFLMLKENDMLRGVDQFVWSNIGLPFQQQMFELLDIDTRTVINPAQGRQFHVQAKKLLVPSLLSKLNEVNAYECGLLRKFLIPFAVDPAVNGRRFYVSRKKAGTRYIVNEAEVLGWLEQLGFVSVELETLSLKEQIGLFRKAEIIIGAHGSAFTNIVFSKPGTKLVDVLPDTNIVSCFYGIAGQLGVDYFGYIDKAVPVNQSSKNDCILVDMEQFKEYLQAKVLN
jgi:hypothetical protein